MSIVDHLDPMSIGIGIGIGFLMAYSFISIDTSSDYQQTKTKEKQEVIIPVNPAIDKDNPKVGHKCTIQDIEDLIAQSGDKQKVSYCRCWRSETFPYCDGAHRDYNQECGDNTGPLTIVKA